MQRSQIAGTRLNPEGDHAARDLYRTRLWDNGGETFCVWSATVEEQEKHAQWWEARGYETRGEAWLPELQKWVRRCEVSFTWAPMPCPNWADGGELTGRASCHECKTELAELQRESDGW